MVMKDTLNSSHSELHSMSGDNNIITSWNGRYHACMQGDGNFVIYSIPKVKGDSTRVIWASNSNQKHPSGDYKCCMQGDGNLVIYHGNKATWDSNTCDVHTHKKGPYYCRLYDSGSLKIFDGKNEVIWSSPIDNHIKSK